MNVAEQQGRHGTRVISRGAAARTALPIAVAIGAILGLPDTNWAADIDLLVGVEDGYAPPPDPIPYRSPAILDWIVLNGSPILDFDQPVSDDAIGWTFQFTVPPGYYISSATLEVQLKSSGFDPGTDQMVFDGSEPLHPGKGYYYVAELEDYQYSGVDSLLTIDLGAVLVRLSAESQTPTPISLLPELADGEFDVGLSDDSMVDYSRLRLFLAPAACSAEQYAKLLPSDGSAWNWFGVSAALSADRAVIGAEGYHNHKGAAYVFVGNGTEWTQEAELTECEGVEGCHFGVSVGISSDTIVVGADRADIAGVDSGAAYVFVRQGFDWVLQQRLSPSDAAAEDTFGYSVAISGDVIVVGSFQDDDAGSRSGSAYVFTREGNVWTEQAKLTASDAAGGQCFGYAVAVSGETIVVGAIEAFAAGPQFGAAYVFTRNGSTWTEHQKLNALQPLEYEQFGSSVSVAENTVVIGARGSYDHSPGFGRFYGSAAYVFVNDGLVWHQEAKLTLACPMAWDSFGYSVSVSGDTVLVGAFGQGADFQETGAAYMYRRPKCGWMDMTESAKLVPDDAAPGYEFGYSVSVNDGYALIGAADDDDNGQNSGSAYVFGVVREGCPDRDADSVADVCDNCPCLGNPDQTDNNGDGIGDACETSLAILGSWPPDGAIDARQPSDPSGSQLCGWNSVEIILSGDVSGLTADDFAVTEVGGDTVAPSIAEATMVSPGTVQITLADRIEPGAWTVFTHKASCTQTSLGYLPGDVNGDGTSFPGDILACIDNLNGAVQPPYPIWQCDIDCSGRCTPADILREIDLLNGADEFEIWLGRQLPQCLPNP